MNTSELFLFLLFGYIATVAIELPVLMWGLSDRHSKSTKLTSGLLLTGFTYPIVVLVLPVIVSVLWGQTVYLVIAETYAPIVEVLFFRFMTSKKLFAKPDRDAVVIILANVLSFLVGAAFLSNWILLAIRWLLNS